MLPNTIRQLAHKFEFGIPVQAFRSTEDYVQSLMLQRSTITLQAFLNSAPKYTYNSSLPDGKNKIIARAQSLKHLSEQWLASSIKGQNHFHEHLVFFWHNLFGVKLYNPLFMAQHIDLIRSSCFGNYRDMLIQMTQDAAMLRFLNLQLSTPQQPNENYARELLELYSLGVGGYSEKEIKIIAAILTGYRSDEDGRPYRIKRFVNQEEYSLFGKTGIKNLDGVIDAILSQPQCAYFITERFCTFFLKTNLSQEQLQEIAQPFYKSNYQLSVLYSKSIEFWLEKIEVQQQTLYSSPIQFLAKTMTLFPAHNIRQGSLSQAQRILGQELLFPPSVAGWPIHMEWFDASSFMRRIDFLEAVQSGKWQVGGQNEEEEIDNELPSFSSLNSEILFNNGYGHSIRNWNSDAISDLQWWIEVCFPNDTERTSALSKKYTKITEDNYSRFVKDLLLLPEFHTR